MYRKIGTKRCALILTITLLLLHTSFSFAFGNLLCDYGFEESDSNGSFPNSGCWISNASDFGGAGSTTTAARLGENGLWQYTGIADSDRLSEAYQDCPAVELRSYFASAWVRTGSQSFSWVEGSKAKIKIAFLDITKNTLLEYSSDEIDISDSDWTLLYFATNPAPRHTRYIRFVLSLEKPQAVGISVVNFDDCILREIECSDCIQFEEIPPCGSTGKLKGFVSNINPDDYSIVVYIFNEGWWPKPSFASPWTNIETNGSWQCDISTSLPYDLSANQVIAFLVPKAEIADWPVDFEDIAGLPAMPAEAFRFPSVGAFRPSCGSNAIQFAGYNWYVKHTINAKADPGQNWFDCNNAWVDTNGLHLKINNKAGKWQCVEVFTEESLGDGTYKFELQNNPLLDPNVILGIFTWDEFAPHYKNREMDIEIGRWSDPDKDNAQFVVQPWNKPGHLHRFNIYPSDAETITHSFNWGRGIIAFDSFFDADNDIQSWAYAGTDVPWPGGENIRINLWLNGGRPYYNGETEVVIKNFEFIPCKYEVEQSSVDFGSVLVTKSSTRPVTVTNTGQCSPYIVTLDVNGPDADNFLVADWAFSLEPGESKQIDVAFVPDTNRIFNANLRIIGDRRIVNVPLTGKGVRFEYTRIPSIASPDYLQGTVSSLKFSDYRVVSYIYTGKWYIKPWANKSALRPISSSGAWKCDIDVNAFDKTATKVASFLIPKTAAMPPFVLNSLNDPQMSQYMCIYGDKPSLAITNVTAKAGSLSNDDSIVLDGRYYITLAELISTNQLRISILQADEVIWNISVPFNFNDVIRPDGFTYNKNNIYISMKNFWKRPPMPYEYAGDIHISLYKVDLSCLRSPFTIKVEIGDYSASARIDESLDALIINGAQPIPIQFLANCTNYVRVDKVKVKNSSTQNKDYVYVKGALVFRDLTPDLTIEDVSIGWGNSAFTVPAGTFKRTRNAPLKYSCTKADAGGGTVKGLFDFQASRFWLKVNNTTLDAKSDNMPFNLSMGVFSEGVSVSTNH